MGFGLKKKKGSRCAAEFSADSVHEQSPISGSSSQQKKKNWPSQEDIFPRVRTDSEWIDWTVCFRVDGTIALLPTTCCVFFQRSRAAKLF